MSGNGGQDPLHKLDIPDQLDILELHQRSMYDAQLANHRGFTDQMQSLANLFKPLQKLAIISFCCLLMAGCTYLRFPGVFRIDIGQGNIITSDMIEKLKVGMTKRQVEYVMGSAMVQDPFSPGRWDYVYSYETGRGTLVRNRLTLYFDGERLQRIDDSQLKDPDALRDDLRSSIREERD